MLSREEFVARFFPRYREPYRPPSGIRMVRGASGALRVQMSTDASRKGQETKRRNRIDAAYADYCAHYAARAEMNAAAGMPPAS